jgi:hypothetical protein
MHAINARRTLLFLLLLSASIAFAQNTTPFGPPVKVTPPTGFGYEPSFVVDRFNNIFATAHKENWQLVLSPDPNSPTQTRSMSWAWISTDNGQTWPNIPGLTALSLEQHEFGDEGDMALDDADHLYFVDTNVADDSITRWKTNGLGNVTLEMTRQVLPAAQLIDDRPWITAHGNGHVFYLGNEGDKVTYPLGNQGTGCGPGRYTVYRSLNGGDTFDPLGCTLPDSGWCRPASDHRAGKHTVYALCGNDGGSDDVISPIDPLGKLYAYVSLDDGQSWNRYNVGTYKALDTTFSWPSVEVAPDGTLYAIYVDAHQLECETDPIFGTSCDTDSNRIMLYQSSDEGKTWRGKDITWRPGRYRYAWLSISPDGSKLGVGVYYRRDDTLPWRVYGAIFKPGQKLSLTSLDEAHPVAEATAEAPGDYMGSYFLRDGTLGVIWTRRVLVLGDPSLATAAVERDIYFARSLK